MVLIDVLEYDAKTKKSRRYKKQHTFPAKTPEAKGVDLNKLKAVLLDKGVINSEGDLE